MTFNHLSHGNASSRWSRDNRWRADLPSPMFDRVKSSLLQQLTFRTVWFGFHLIFIDWTPWHCPTNPSRFIVPVEKLCMILFPLTKKPFKITTWTFSDKTRPVRESRHSSPYETAYEQGQLFSKKTLNYSIIILVFKQNFSRSFNNWW